MNSRALALVLSILLLSACVPRRGKVEFPHVDTLEHPNQTLPAPPLLAGAARAGHKDT